ncbi:hypothetical protein ES702_00936 [subsurface metagenome]
MRPINGVVIGVVTQVRKGEVKVKFPWLHERKGEEKESNWARIATAMAGNDRGTFLTPEVNDEVWVVFEHGDVNVPIVIGFLWSGKDKPPENDTKKRVIKTRSGHTITLSDKNGEEEIKIEHKIGAYVLLDSTGKITF